MSTVDSEHCDDRRASWWTDKRLERHGWQYYSYAPFSENVDSIADLIGTALYEVLQIGELVYIRRAAD